MKYKRYCLETYSAQALMSMIDSSYPNCRVVGITYDSLNNMFVAVLEREVEQ